MINIENYFTSYEYTFYMLLYVSMMIFYSVYSIDGDASKHYVEKVKKSCPSAIKIKPVSKWKKMEMFVSGEYSDFHIQS
jgi:hypothetical protein